MNRRQALLGAAALAACAPANGHIVAPFPMRRGVNLGNALEASNEGDWGYRIEAAHLRAIADAGFDGVRLPVRWDAHAGSTPPYAVAPDFYRRVDEVIAQALGAGLKVQLDLHHYDALMRDGPESRHAERSVGIWRGIAHHYRDAPAELFFEPLNEPNGALWTNAALTALQRELVGVIRARNPERLIVLGPGNWQNIDALNDWRPPEGENIAVSVHYYEPHAFTHQGAEWLSENAPTFDRAWGGEADRAAIRRDLRSATRWANTHGYALQLGEFGVNRHVSPAQRALWTRCVREACDAENLAWCIWDFAGAFPIHDSARQAFIPEMTAALFDQ